MFEGRKARMAARLERERERFRSPRTPEGVRLANAEMVLWVAVIVVVLFVVALIPNNLPLGKLAVFILGVLALSDAGKRTVVPIVYGFLAAKFHWCPYDEAVQKESTARAVERGDVVVVPAVTPAAAVAPTTAPGALDATSMEMLRVYLGLSRDERKEGLAIMLEHFAKHGTQFPELAEAETDEGRFELAQIALKRLAKTHGITI